MPINYKPDYIKLVGKYEGNMEAWFLSRPFDTTSTSRDVLHENLPVNGFNHYHFEIQSPLLLRDILFMVRPSNNWARSNRAEVVDETTLGYSSSLTDQILPNSKYWRNHQISVDQSIPLDYRKSYFLYGVSTTYSFMTDARTLANILASMAKIPYLEPYYRMFSEELYRNDVTLPPNSTDNFFQNLGIDLKDLDPEDVLVIEDPYTGLISVLAEMTGNLLSQFIRQEFGIAKSTLINRVLSNDIPVSQNELFYGQLILTKDRVHKIVRTRACWFAQWDSESKASWSRIISKLIRYLEMTPEDVLICKGNYKDCKFLSAQLSRIKAGNGNGDVNLPCPILCGIPKLYEMRGKVMNSDSELFRYWKDYSQINTTITEYGNSFIDNVHNYGYAQKEYNEILGDIYGEKS